MLPNCIEYVDLIFGCSLLGAIVVHLHTASKGPILERAMALPTPLRGRPRGRLSRFEDIDLDPLSPS